MMLVRAIFWVGVMALLVPHDPSLGFAGTPASRAVQGAACTADLNTCIHQQNSADALRALFLARVEQVRIDLAATRR